jgi:ketosteroid isomerase-like protein
MASPRAVGIRALKLPPAFFEERKMNSISKALVILTGGLLFALPAAADEAARKKAEREVAQAVHELNAAYASEDVDKYFSYYAEDMDKCCGRGGWDTKQNYYKTWKEMVASGNGLAKAEARDLRIQVSPKGDAAIAAFKLHCERLRTAEGQSPTITYHMTQVWMNRNGKWEIANITYMEVQDPQRAGPATVAATKNPFAREQ